MATAADIAIRFDRVLIDNHGYVVSPQVAVDVYNIYPEIAFLRKDGFAIAAPHKLEKILYKMWKDEWTHFMRKPNRVWSDIENYL